MVDMLYHSKKDSNIFQIFQIFLKHSSKIFQKEYFFEIFESTARFKVWRSSEVRKKMLSLGGPTFKNKQKNPS